MKRDDCTPVVVGGVFEVGVGVPDEAEALAYWESFGYRAGDRGHLSAQAAYALYGVDSELSSLRLLHQDAESSLVRLMVWDQPTGPGLGLADLRTPGNRWAVAKTLDVLAVANHARVLESQGEPIHYTEPVFRLVGTEISAEPFRRSITCKSEVIVFRPHSRHVLVQRYGHDLPKFGTYNRDCLFQSSEFTQVGICIAGDDSSPLDFYDRVLGFKRTSERRVVATEGSIATAMLPMEVGEVLWETDFDDRRAGSSPDEQLPGKLRAFRLPAERKEDSRVGDSRPGNLGFSLYTCRVSDIDGMHANVAGGGADGVTEIMSDEFGRAAFSFVAPDGYFWTVMSA